ncbi:MAG: cytochrome c-type biogenesis protein CcmH [Anaerolineae bacterium]|nr:cytochrome c-type biogenesis protein CcmH [Anaerolineae bacterium]
MKKVLLILIGLLAIFVLPALGQEEDPSVSTEEHMLAVAARMYCPICENEPLDECRNPTCLEWKAEIRRLIAEGYTDEEIITSFVDRYGQHVVGVPYDPTLRGLSFFAPIIGTILAFGVAFYIFWQWQRKRSESESKSVQKSPQAGSTVDDEFRALIERDLQ